MDNRARDKCKTQTRQQTNTRLDETKRDRNKIRHREGDTTSGQPKNSADPAKQERGEKKRNKAKTEVKHKEANTVDNKGNTDEELETEEMDWTGRDWEDADGDGDGDVACETLEAHKSLRSRRACETK